MNIAIETRKLGKHYRLGEIGTGLFFREIQSTFARLFGREDPNTEIGAQDLWALRDLDLDIRAGEIVGLAGSNGAGKSTLLKILSRVTEPTSGCARVRGRVAGLLEVGAGFHTELTGEENIYLYGAIHGMSRREIRARFDSIASFSELGEFLDTPVKRYSTGMVARLAFSVVQGVAPDIYLVDEVLSVADPEFQKKCMDFLRTSGKTVLIVSHQRALLDEFCTRIITLKNGLLLGNA